MYFSVNFTNLRLHRFTLLSRFLIFFLAIGFTLHGQQSATYIKRVMDFQSGNVSAIYDVFTGSKGLLYLGTDGGLMSFNGVSFKNYTLVDNLALSIHRIQQDAQGTIWGKNFSNQLFYLKNDTLIPNTQVEKLCTERNENFVDFTFFKDKLLVLTEERLYLENEEGFFQPVLDAETTGSGVFYTVYKSDEELFVTGDKNIIEINSSFKSITYNSRQGQKELIKYGSELFYILKGRNNNLISVKNGLLLLDEIPENTYYYGISETNSGLWLCSSNGLFKLNVKTGIITEKLLLNQRVTKIVKDREGGCWISTLDEGLYYMPNELMQHLKFTDNSKAGVKFRSLKRTSNGHLLAGTSHGRIIEYDSSLKPVQIYKGSNNLEVEYIYNFYNQIISTVGVFERGKPKPLVDAYFGKGVAADEFGNFLFANYNQAGLISQKYSGLPTIPGRISKDLNVFNYVNDLKIAELRGKRARVVHYSNKYRGYYVGFSDGFYYFKLDGTVEVLTTPTGEPIIAVDLKEGTNGDLWIATSQQGVFQITGNKVVLNLNRSKGLSENRCKKIQVQNNGLWIITDEGLNYYDIVSNKLINYVDRLALSDIRINDFLVDDNKIWFATQDGIIHFDKDILKTQRKPVFEIEAKLKSNDHKTLPKNTVLVYGKNQIEFNFNTIYFKSLGNFVYEYKLEPLHREWQTQTSKQAKLNFLLLQPGNYKLSARIKTGSTFSEVRTFNFSVATPFWGQWWFKILLFLSFILFFILVYKWAALRTKRKQSTKEMLAISQLTALRSQMNPHFMFNVLNAVQGLIYSNQKSQATEYLGTFSNLMRKTLDMSDKKEVTIAEEVETIEIYISLEKARFEEDDFEFEMIIPNDDLTRYAIPSLIIQPFVENAIKHGLMHKSGKKRLVIKLSKAHKGYWEFLIEDNGVGREASAHINRKIRGKHHSFATKAIDNRINLINKLIEKPISIEVIDLVSEQMRSTGTRVIINIPIKEI